MRRLSAVLVFLGLAAAGWAAPHAAAEPDSGFPTDERGYVGTAAHCQGSAVAVAYGRTASSLVAICSGSGGQLQFRGLRLTDDAALMLAAHPVRDGFRAVNDGVTYTVTPTELTVASADRTLIRQAMVDYHGAAARGA